MATIPTVSCVIPVFNGERYLSESIESVLAQNHFVAEIIVVDDGSTDGTKDAAARFSDRVTYLRQQNSGPSSARNRGIQHASADFVTFLDSDDLWLPHKTAIQLARFRERPELGICTAHMRNFWSAEVEHEALMLENSMLTEIQPNVSSSFMARRSVFQTVGMLHEAYRHRDLHDLIVRASDQGLAAECLGDVLVRRRIHELNMSRHRSNEGEMELLAIAKARMARRRKSLT